MTYHPYISFHSFDDINKITLQCHLNHIYSDKALFMRSSNNKGAPNINFSIVPSFRNFYSYKSKNAIENITKGFLRDISIEGIPFSVDIPKSI